MIQLFTYLLNQWSCNIMMSSGKSHFMCVAPSKFTIYFDRFVSTDSAETKFYETTISKQLIREVYCMQGQDDDASSLEDDHAPRSTPGKVKFQVGNYCVVNYEEELWPGQITKIISSSLIRFKCYEKAVPAGANWRWPKKTEQDYHTME